MDQLKWYFDKAKNPPRFINSLEDAINGLDLTRLPASTLQKFKVNSIPEMQMLLDRKLNSIFELF